MEGIRLDSVRRAHPDEAKIQIEEILIPEMNAAALERAQSLSDLESATAMLHILIDAAIYAKSKEASHPEPVASSDTPSQAPRYQSPQPRSTAHSYCCRRASEASQRMH